MHSNTAQVNTVLGPVAATELGVVAPHEALLSVLPGAEHAFDIAFDRAEIFETLAANLTAFRQAGGGTVVDSTGMFHGRDVTLLEALARSTGVHIVASTGMGPEEMLGGYFLTPQTNPPTPWPADKFADLFGKEITEGMVVPRLERRQPAGLIATTATATGMTATDESLLRGAARAAAATGVALSFRFGADALAEVQVALAQGLPADRIVVGGADRTDADPQALADLGVYVAIDHVGSDDDPAHLTDDQRVRLVAELIEHGHRDRILLSSNAIGVAKGLPACDIAYSQVLTGFVPLLRDSGVDRSDIEHLLVVNPARLLAVVS